MKILLALLCLSAFTSAFAQESYPMTCVFDGSQTIGFKPSLTDPKKLVVSFSFRKGTKPATEGVEPGTCAWDDRGINRDEPTSMAQIVDHAMTYFEMSYKGMTQLILVPMNAYWAPQAMVRGYKIRFKVYQSGPAHGYSTNFFSIAN